MELATDPLNTSYIIGNRVITLQNGQSEMEAAPGSASTIKTNIWGDMIYGDLDSDDIENVVLILVQSIGGSGTFYYVAAAVNQNGKYHGTNAILLGDRIAPQNVSTHNGLIVANYTDRRPGEPMTALPSVCKSKYFFLKNKELVEIKLPSEGQQVFEGWVTIGHEVRSFAPCLQKRTLWLMGNSPSMEKIIKSYQRFLPNSNPYTPLFMILTGKITDPPIDGYGRDYEAAFFAEKLVLVVPKGNCRSGSVLRGLPLTIANSQQTDDVLTGNTWKWEQTIYNNDTKVVPADPNQYTLELQPDGKVNVRADCNRGGGTYVKEGSSISMNVTHTTRAMCPSDSLEGEFLRNLAVVAIYFMKDGNLYFDLKFDTGTMKFIK
jgi:heat shock protein HslJ